MNRRDRELLDRRMSRIQSQLRRDGVLILGMVGVFICCVMSMARIAVYRSRWQTTGCQEVPKASGTLSPR